MSARLHRKNKVPSSVLPLRIRLYEIQNLKHADAKMEEFKRFTFDTRSFNPYDAHCFLKDDCVRMQFIWIHGACHWLEEDPWRYYHSFSRLNVSVNITMEWLAKWRKETSQREASSTTVEGNTLSHDKGKRKVVDNAEEEQSRKFKVEPLVMKEALEIEAKT